MNRVPKNGFVWAALCAVLAVGLMTTCADAQNVGRAQYEVYRCRHKSAAEVEKLLKDLLPLNDPNVHLVVDHESNALLLRGGPDVQKVAASLLQHVDRPAPVAASSAPTGMVVQVYRSPPGQLDRWLGTVRALCGDATGVKVTVARDSNQIIVLGPQTLHQQISYRLNQKVSQPSIGPASQTGTRQAGTRSAVSTPAARAQLGAMLNERPPMRRLPGAPALHRQGAASVGAGAPSVEVDRILHLRQVATADLERRLIALFGRRLRAMRRDGREVLVLPIDEHRAIEFQLDHGRNLLLVRGPDSIVQQFSQLVDAIDAGGRPGQRTEALHVERTSDGQLQEAVDAYRGRTPTPGVGGTLSGDQTSYVHSSGVRLVNYLYQQPGVGTGGTAGAAAGDGLGSSVVPNVPGLNDLEVQTLPDLDVIILRGRDQDVEQLTKIIRELERLSAETIPKIHMYHLKHTRGESINEIINDVQEELVGRRQGRVSVTPLVKPNSLLLIGWGEAVDAMIELISKLDRPVPPESQFAVFPLKHAAVTTVQQTITQFFGSRSGLGPRVETAADARTNSLIVYAAPRDMVEVRRLVTELDVPSSEAVNRARIFRVQNALATDVATTLQLTITAAQSGQNGRSAVLELMAIDQRGQEVIRSGMLNDVSITPNARNNTLIVTGPSDAMALIEAFIEQLDTPGDRAQIKVFRVLNGDATNLVSMLRSLMPSQVGQAPLGPQLPTAPDEESLAPLRFSVEMRSNSIIAIGSEGDLRIVEALLSRLDQNESMNRKNAVYLLKNSPAVDVATSINEFLRSQRTLEAAEPGQSNPFHDLEREVIVVPEPVGNRLIVSATPRYFDEITQLIEKLDEPPAQVVIQALIAEIILGDRDEFGVELGLQDSVLFDRSLLGDLLTTVNSGQISDPSGILTSTQEIIQAATNTPGYEFNNQSIGNSGSDSALKGSKTLGSQALSSFDLGRLNDDAGFGGLVLAASSRNISILIRAMQEDRRMRILSRPLVRTLDNQPAYIQVGQRVPRIIGTTLGVNGQSNQISLENVGLILGVTPRISPDGNVVMEIDAEKSKVGPEDEGIPVGTSVDGTVIRSPRVDTITAQATVSVADGETVVLGGMIATEIETIARRAPYLADIPVLGHLFRYDFKTERRAEMLIILTPHVIRNQADAERIKQAEFARMSWCAADVYDLYGDVGMDFQTNMAVPTDGVGTEVIYPDQTPLGSELSEPGASAIEQPREMSQDRLLPQPDGQLNGQFNRRFNGAPNTNVPPNSSLQPPVNSNLLPPLQSNPPLPPNDRSQPIAPPPLPAAPQGAPRIDIPTGGR